MKRKKPTQIPVMAAMCVTCPFRRGSPVEDLRDYLSMSALTEGSRICHSTGNNPLIKRVNVPERLCRGARDLQIAFFAGLGFIESATDEAWNKKVKECNL